MDFLFPVVGLAMLVGTTAYLHAVVKLHNIITAEHPEWVGCRGSLSFFYTGMPRVSDPNVNLAVIGVALSSRWRSLGAPDARRYVRRIRILLPTLLAVFGIVLVAIAVGAP